MTKFETKIEVKTNELKVKQKALLFPEVDPNYDVNVLEEKILGFWEKEKVFEQLLAKNQKLTKRFSFLDGPITANNPMGVHTAWGRSLKDLVQRYWAMKGFKQRFQNGFDCQGLWVEVEVEKALDLNSKQEIEAFGLEKFTEQCKMRVEKYSSLITEQSKRLGQWMDWDNSYYTHTDTNISYIWHFLKKCHEKGWLITDNYPMPWCTRCGTSLSQHEQHGSYEELTHTAIYVKFPMKEATHDTTRKKSEEKSREYLLVWTTTPWTLTANTAVAVNPNLTYCKIKQGEEIYFLAKNRLEIVKDDYSLLKELPGEELVDREYKMPFQFLPVQQQVNHRVVEWPEVGADEGSGLVHIAPGCGAEDFALGQTEGLAILSPIDDFGVFLEGYGLFTGLTVKETSTQVTSYLQKQGLLYASEQYTHRYPTCWRCHEELVFRLVEEWFIDCEEIRPLLKQAAKKVQWTPEFYDKLMQDWLNNMGNWCISRKRYWGLPLPFFVCNNCGKLTVIGSKEELLDRAVEGKECLQELHRPWIDEVKIKCPECGSLVTRIPEVGDCWLDAGIVPFSTLQYLEDPDYWSKWFPVDMVCEMREQIRLWFYAQLFMSVTLTGEPPYKQVVIYEKVHDKDGRPMHRSWGNSIWFDEAVERMGADVMRWAYAKQPLVQTMNFGFYLKEEVRPFFLTLWNVYAFFATFANLDQFNPTMDDRKKHLSTTQSSLLDRWLLSQLQQLIQKIRQHLDQAEFQQATTELEEFVDLLSTWYIRRSRQRFWKNENSREKQQAYFTLYETLLTLCKLLAPVTPFFSEELYQNLTGKVDPKAPVSVHLCSYPSPKKKLIDEKLNKQMAIVREVVKLGRAARNKANKRLRQPLAEIAIWCKNQTSKETLLRFEQTVKQELNVKKVTFEDDLEKLCQVSVKPNYQRLGPVLREKIVLLENKLEEISQKEILHALNQNDKLLRIALKPEEEPLQLQLQKDLELEIEAKGSGTVEAGSDFAVSLETSLSEELLLEGLARDIVRHIQNLRKKSGFQIEDQIITYFDSQGQLTKAMKRYSEYIKTETLSVELKQAQLSKEQKKRATKDLKKNTNKRYWQKTVLINDQKIILRIKKFS
ncbi:MAG: isoleucine--tRNA ligase [Candidatus Heimdallarchaeota archaeon]|nr:isoleucine--tRNA ligase [Candidatus Heimdallarchaeota archaeon]